MKKVSGQRLAAAAVERFLDELKRIFIDGLYRIVFLFLFFTFSCVIYSILVYFCDVFSNCFRHWHYLSISKEKHKHCIKRLNEMCSNLVNNSV